MSTQAASLFQGTIARTSSGELADQEGMVIFPQTIIGTGAGPVAGQAIYARQGYFFEFWFDSFAQPGGTTMFLRAYPPGTQSKAFGDFLAGNLDLSLDLTTLTQPAKIIIPPGWLVVPVWLNGGADAKATITIVGVQLKDCPANNRGSII